MPRSIEDVTKFDDPERSIQYHSGTAAQQSAGTRGGRRTSVYHGQGTGTDERVRKQPLIEYCQWVSTAVNARLQREKALLVVISEETLLGLYRDANAYPMLHDKAVHEHPDMLKPEELHAHALEVVKPALDESRGAAINRYRRLANTALASSKLGKIMAAAHNSQIELLLVRQGLQKWGCYDTERGYTQVHDSHKPMDYDLLDLAAVQTWLNGGAVHILPAEVMPEEAPAAATFRFAT
jgi:hypothetical protein